MNIPTSCSIRHISLVPWCVGLDRFHCISNKPCQCRNTDYWADDTLGD